MMVPKFLRSMKEIIHLKKMHTLLKLKYMFRIVDTPYPVSEHMSSNLKVCIFFKCVTTW